MLPLRLRHQPRPGTRPRPSAVGTPSPGDSHLRALQLKLIHQYQKSVTGHRPNSKPTQDGTETQSSSAMPTHIWPMTTSKSGLSPGARLARACPHMSSMNYSAANRSSVCMWHVSPMCRSSTAKLSKSQMRRPQVAATMHIMGVTITRGLSSRASSHWSTKGVNVAAGPPATSTTTPPPPACPKSGSHPQPHSLPACRIPVDKAGSNVREKMPRTRLHLVSLLRKLDSASARFTSRRANAFPGETFAREAALPNRI